MKKASEARITLKSFYFSLLVMSVRDCIGVHCSSSSTIIYCAKGRAHKSSSSITALIN